VGIESDTIDRLYDRLGAIEEKLEHLLQQGVIRDWYSTSQVAERLGKAEFTVREWCRIGRVYAEKKDSGRGKYQGWVISHTELLRIEREGLLPLQRG